MLLTSPNGSWFLKMMLINSTESYMVKSHKTSLEPLGHAGLSLRFQVAGYMWLVDGGHFNSYMKEALLVVFCFCFLWKLGLGVEGWGHCSQGKIPGSWQLWTWESDYQDSGTNIYGLCIGLLSKKSILYHVKGQLWFYHQ